MLYRQIGGKETHVERVCALCGKKVCPSCYRIAIGVCLECMPGKKVP